MFKAVLKWAVILLISIQIPLIILFSGGKIISSSIKDVGQSLDVAQQVAEQVGQSDSIIGSLVGMASKKVPGLAPIVGVVQEYTTTVLAEGQQSIEQAEIVVGYLSHSMYASIGLTLLLIIILALLNSGSIINNIGTSFIIGGILAILSGFMIYNLFVQNFDATYQYLYQMTASKGFTLGLPNISSLVSLFLKPFARGFIKLLANILSNRSFIFGGAITVLGILLRLSMGYFTKKPRSTYGRDF